MKLCYTFVLKDQIGVGVTQSSKSIRWLNVDEHRCVSTALWHSNCYNSGRDRMPTPYRLQALPPRLVADCRSQLLCLSLSLTLIPNICMLFFFLLLLLVFSRRKGNYWYLAEMRSRNIVTESIMTYSGKKLYESRKFRWDVRECRVPYFMKPELYVLLNFNGFHNMSCSVHVVAQSLFSVEWRPPLLSLPLRHFLAHLQPSSVFATKHLVVAFNTTMWILINCGKINLMQGLLPAYLSVRF